MSVGQIARRLLGRRFKPVGELYRSIFVNVQNVADFISKQIPDGGKCLDIGGGDGMIVDAILRLRPDLYFTMTDIAPQIGAFIDPRLSHRVDLHPGTAARELIAAGYVFDAITIADVLHHVPADARLGFWLDLKAICRDTNCRLIVVKDVRPGTIRGFLSVLSDRYVTGDRHVTLMAADAMSSDIRRAFQDGLADISEAEPDRANYCLVIRLN